MIIVNVAVNVEAGTVTYTLKDEGYDHEFQGRQCHAVDLDPVEGAAARQMLRQLGYLHIGCELKPTGVVPWDTRHVEFWAKPELKPTEGGETP